MFLSLFFSDSFIQNFNKRHHSDSSSWFIFTDNKDTDKSEAKSSIDCHLLVCCAIEPSVVFMYVLIGFNSRFYSIQVLFLCMY